MPRVDIPVITLDPSVLPAFVVDLDPPVASDASDDMIVQGGADGKTVLIVENENAAPQTIEVVANPALEIDGLTIGALEIEIQPGDTVYTPTFRTSTFRQNGAENDLFVNVSIDTDLKFRAIRIVTPR